MTPLKTHLKRFIPAALQFRLVNLKHHFTKFKQVHYSQNGEDIILAAIFPKSYAGFYIDVGAHHPYRISNTALLHERGWVGINIDANPETIAMFKRVRPHDINLNIGISESDQSLIYHTFSDPAVNTFSDSEAEKWRYKKWITYLGTTTVPTKTLASVLNEHLPKNQKIDLLSVDVEGLDLAVLSSNNWTIYRPKVIVVESHSFRIISKGQNELYRFLTAQKYELRHVLNFSLIFIDTQQTAQEVS